MADRRKMGLCYNCDEPYVRGHKCARLFFLEAANYVVEEPDDDTEPADASFNSEKPMISLAAITGIRVEKTMQLPVQIGTHRFTALLDSRSTHNFIDVAAARRAGLQVDDHPSTHVVVANGDQVACRGLNRAVPLQIGDTHFAVDCFAVPLPHYDMVLGISWLRTLGPILWDFDGLRMAFVLQGRRVLWTGIGSPNAAPNAQQADARLASTIYIDKGAEPALLERLLDLFSDLFTEPTGLPPERPCDHRIHLKPGTEPIAVRPYRYPHLQKDELERQCDAMLQQGVIRESMSPFSAPVLLVRKHDASWRFCVDYRALNAVTVKDIPDPGRQRAARRAPWRQLLHQAGSPFRLSSGPRPRCGY